MFFGLQKEYKLFIPQARDIYESNSKCACTLFESYARVRAHIFIQIFLVVTDYLMNPSFKFHEDRSFRWGDIWLLVTMYAV